MNQRAEADQLSHPPAYDQGLIDRAVYLPRLGLVLAWLSVVVGRGLSTALPGTLTGADRQIGVMLYLGAFLTQFCALTGAGLTIHLVVRVAALARVPAAVKAAAVLMALTVIGAVLLASRPLQLGLAPRALFLLGMLTSSWVIWVNLPGLQQPQERGLSLLSIAAALAAAIHTLGRSLGSSAAYGADVLAFQWARGVATAGFAVELLAVVGAYVWVLRSASTTIRAVAAVMLAALAAVVYGLDDAGSGWRLIVARTLEQLLAHPDPFVSPALRQLLELSALAGVGLTLAARFRQATSTLVVGLVLLARASADVPIGGLFFAVAGLTRVLQLRPSKPSVSASE